MSRERTYIPCHPSDQSINAMPRQGEGPQGPYIDTTLHQRTKSLCNSRSITTLLTSQH